MADNLPFLKPLAIAAGVLGAVQALTWGILSLLGILLYTEDIELEPSSNVSYLFRTALVEMYFIQNTLTFSHMTSGTIAFWTSTYFVSSVIWFVISCILLYESYKSRFIAIVIIGWVTVSAIVAAIDFAGIVAFGVDYYRVQNSLDDQPIPIQYGVEYLLVPLFMMIMCARGFILWIINVGLAIYLGVAERKLHKKGSSNFLQDPEYLSPYQGRQNTAIRPNSIHSWGTHPPTVGNQHSIPRDIAPKNVSRLHDAVNPIPSIPRPGNPLPAPAHRRSFRMQTNSRTVSYF
jgi:hypothetical protein